MKYLSKPHPVLTVFGIIGVVGIALNVALVLIGVPILSLSKRSADQ